MLFQLLFLCIAQGEPLSADQFTSVESYNLYLSGSKTLSETAFKTSVAFAVYNGTKTTSTTKKAVDCRYYDGISYSSGDINERRSAYVQDNCGNLNYCFMNGVFVGSYSVDSGPSWTSLPLSYTCQTACSLVFGAGCYQCSTTSSSITGTAYYSVIGYPDCPEFPDNQLNPTQDSSCNVPCSVVYVE